MELSLKNLRKVQEPSNHLEINDDRTRGQHHQAQAMSVDQAVEHFLEQRERYGFSSILLFDEQMESFAPVVARLTGK